MSVMNCHVCFQLTLERNRSCGTVNLASFVILQLFIDSLTQELSYYMNDKDTQIDQYS